MGWLRLDDGFAHHPKIIQLADRELRVWLATLLYCARYRTRGEIRREAFPSVGLDAKLIAKLTRLELLDEGDEEGLWIVHDFELYNPKDPAHAERQARYRARRRDGESDGERDATRDGESDGAERHSNVTRPSRARAGSRARPVPSPESDPLRVTLSGGPTGRKPTTPQQAASPAANGIHRPAVDVARDRIRNIGAELPTNDLAAELRDALGDRYDELTPDDLVELADLHADTQETT
jgi:hypothetical protein